MNAFYSIAVDARRRRVHSMDSRDPRFNVLTSQCGKTFDGARAIQVTWASSAHRHPTCVLCERAHERAARIAQTRARALPGGGIV